MWETWVRFLGWEDPLEKGTVTHSNILAWRTPWTVQSDMTKQLSVNNTTNKPYSMNAVLKLGIFFSNHRIPVLNQKYLVF